MVSSVRFWSRPLVLAAVLIGAVVAAYALSLRGDFLWDDDLHITANPTIVGPLGLKEIWTTSRANYFPLVLTNFWIQHALWELNPLGYRIVTLLFHAGAGVLLWRVLLRLRVPGAWLGAALWALHPVQVESVAWICELKNTQSAVFFLAAIWAYVRWLEVGRVCDPPSSSGERSEGGSKTRPTWRVRRFYAFALVFAVLAILSKPSTVMLPLALALCAWWLRRRFVWRDFFPLVPFFALSALAAGWTIWEQKIHSGASGAEWAQTWPERCVIAGRAVWFYLGSLVWPGSLSFIYPRWVPNASDFAAFLPLVGAVAGLGWLGWRHRVLRGGFFAAAYFVALLFPVLGFFDIYFFRYAFVGDHFQYLASIGPLVALAAGLARIVPRAVPMVGGAGVIALALMTAVQSTDYRSSESLWRATVTRNPDSAMAWAQLGAVHARAARHGEAVACFQRALRINSKHPEALNHLGCEYLRAGRVDDAVAELERAIEARPGFAEAHCNLGTALLQGGRVTEALSQFEIAQRQRPDAAEPRYQMARALHALGRASEAIALFEHALRLEPGRAQTYDDLGLAFVASGRLDDAVAAHQQATRLQPTLASARNHLGVAFAQGGRLPDALAQFDEAVRLDPAYGDAHVNRGGALVALNRLPEAGEAFTRAVRVMPNSAKAHAYLGQILQALGRESEGREHLARAEQLERQSPAPGR